MPVFFNPLTKEPYLRLPAPCSHIIITMDRLHDIEETSKEMTKILNDPLVYPWLEGPPYPFLPKDGEDWIKLQCKESESVLSRLQQEYERSRNQTKCKDAGDQVAPKEFFDVCAFRCIREVTEYDLKTGAALKDVYIGSISIARYSFYELAYGSSEREEAQARNNEIPAGDKGIVWGLGNYLSPKLHGQGIMTLAVRTIIRDWAVPRMNMHILKASYLVGNAGSAKVMIKNNFEEVSTLEDWAPESKARGRPRMSIVVLNWKGLS
ncbi:hypothetical protein PENANT_c009G11596 [Penicillium antarcticum]|uniref:Uncharacterized protein n=1 Tax=Penicillium antarcticum TaxID=416450 RepID=A0A1V6Q956_9EURO|nr:uncharacterized protein N7508_008856 [Penicillium antarcticum]KAJ5294035.1 hypothetical protein N7508_008856 [Penicillium antarcticum]OQD85744.1 hypothetical protein PENANT_c009G11596 [Penicillium antarcticum]